MNRPTIELEELLEIADEALAAGDQQQAVAILRQAATVAPLRRDIRNRIAMVLEGTPTVAIPARKRSLQNVGTGISDEYDQAAAPYSDAEDGSSGRDAISNIARKAFDAAVQHKTKAGNATRRLSNLLQSGLETWKSSLAAQPVAAKEAQAETVDSSAQDMVFRPDEELQTYLERQSDSLQSRVEQPEELLPDDATSQEPTVSRVTRSPATSRKSRSSQQKRPSDVEDVLAAGIGGFIDALTRVEKSKIVYAIVYTAMISLFGIACFDVSRKFPQVRQSSGAAQVQVASTGAALQLSGVVESADAVAKARSLAAAGNISDAITMLRAQLQSSTKLQNRDQIRIELAMHLNEQGESLLTGNKITESVQAYREANSYLPNDAKLQLRFANALYYQGIMASADGAEKKKVFQETEALLSKVVAADADNLQAHRLMALVHEAKNNQDQARASWQKVKVLAPKESAILAEAISHLK